MKKYNEIKSIVIFDDDEDILDVCELILEAKGWKVHTFNDCKNVVEKIESISPSVILMDIWIPDIGGVEAGKLIKNANKISKIPLILFSANDNIEELANKATAEFYLEKPFDLVKLESITEEAFNCFSNVI